MYLMYVDESGDPGISPKSPTKFFVLSGIIIHELSWRKFIDEQVKFRKYLKNRFGLKLREEIHCTQLLSKPGSLARIKRNDRLAIIRLSMDWLAKQDYINIITVSVDKRNKTNDNVFESAWQALIQRFENTIKGKNFPGCVNQSDKGMILPDNTDGKKLTSLLRKMRHFNMVPSLFGGSRNLPLTFIVEDPFLKNSATSYFHQMCDVVAYCARQIYEPNLYMKQNSGHLYYNRLDAVLMKKASIMKFRWIIQI